MPAGRVNADRLAFAAHSVSPGPVERLARQVVDAVEAHPEFAPTAAAPDEPLRRLKGSFRAFIEAELARVGGDPLRLILDQGDHGIVTSLDLYPDCRVGRDVQPHLLDGTVSWDRMGETDRGGVVAWALDMFDAIEAFQGSIGLVDHETQVVGLEFEARERGEMWMPNWSDPSFTVYDRWLPDVRWINYLGSAYVERFGIERLSRIGVRHEVRPSGAVVIWATEDPPDRDEEVRRITGFPFKKPFYRELGLEAFVHESLEVPEPGRYVPTLEDHQRAAAAQAGGDGRPTP